MESAPALKIALTLPAPAMLAAGIAALVIGILILVLGLRARRPYLGVAALAIACGVNAVIFLIAKPPPTERIWKEVAAPAPDAPLPQPVPFNGTYPIICADKEGAYLVGGYHNGAPLDEDNIAKYCPDKAQYKLFTLLKKVGSATGSKPEDFECGFGFHVPLQSGWQGDTVLGIACPWEPQPRPPVVADCPAGYKSEVERFIASQGIVKPRVKYLQYLRVDLDGDGSEEEMITAVREGEYPDFWARANDFSCVLLRSAGKKNEYRVIVGEFYPKPIENPENTFPPSRYSIAGIFDVDGDGAEEVLVRGEYYDGELVTASRIRQGKPATLFAGFIGD